MKEQSENLSRRILKALGIFGGMQGILILCSLVRVKLIAIFIGSEGVGLFSIFTNTVDMYRDLSQLSIQQSAVRDVARNQSALNLSVISHIVTRWCWLLGIIGACLLLVSAPFLSRYCFESSDYTWAFAALSVIIFMQAVQAGWLIIMQGTENFSKLVKAQLWSAITGITICAPMYYFWGINSVIPSLIVYALTNLLATCYFRVHVPAPSPKPTKDEFYYKGKKFIKLGFFLTISTFSSLLADFIFKSWLNVFASTVMVGLYSAGFTIINRYVGMILTAISVEYYPRLSRIIHSAEDVYTHVSHEITIALLVLTPLILFFIPLAQFIVPILYSSEFLDIVPFITVAVIGTMFKAVSWCFGFVILAKGDGKIFVVTELLSSIIFLAVNILTYKYYGIRAMGYAYNIWYLLYLISTAIVYFKRFHFTLDKLCLGLLIAGTVLSFVSLLIVSQVHWGMGVALAILITIPYGRKLLKLMKSR